MYGSHKLPNYPHRSPNPKSECDDAENDAKNNQHAKFLDMFGSTGKTLRTV